MSNSIKLDWDALDYRILQNGAISLYWQQSFLDVDIQWFRQNEYAIYLLDSSGWSNIEVFYDAISKTLNFPDYFGCNLHALNDCLSGIEFPESGKILLVFSKFPTFPKEFLDFAWDILDIIEINSRRYLLEGKRFILLIQSDDPKLSFAPVGAHAVHRNQAEWSNSKRGL
jgi:RNAse (barnase) inhibitor barstar